MSDSRKHRERRDKGARSQAPERVAPTPARFKLVCESPDGKLCLFEDADGHFTVVRTARLA